MGNIQHLDLWGFLFKGLLESCGEGLLIQGHAWRVNSFLSAFWKQEAGKGLRYSSLSIIHCTEYSSFHAPVFSTTPQSLGGPKPLSRPPVFAKAGKGCCPAVLSEEGSLRI